MDADTHGRKYVDGYTYICIYLQPALGSPIYKSIYKSPLSYLHSHPSIYLSYLL